MNWYKKYDSWFADLPGGNKALVSTGANDKWHYMFNISEKVWDSDPITRPFDNAEDAKKMAEIVYNTVSTRQPNPIL